MSGFFKASIKQLPTVSEHDKIRETILSRFNRRGGPTPQTGDFRDFPMDVQQRVRAAAKLGADEVPVLLTCRDDHSWTMITTHRLVWKGTLAVESLKGHQMEAIISPSQPNDPTKVPLGPRGVPLAIRIACDRSLTHDLPVEADKGAYAAFRAMLVFVLDVWHLKSTAPATAARALAR